MLNIVNIEKFLNQRKLTSILIKNCSFIKTGFPSIDRPWDKRKKKIEIPNISIYEGLLNRSNFNASNNLSICHEDILTKDRLIRESEEYAKSFKVLGVKKGDIVPICMQPNNEGIITFFALNRIGLVPIEVEYQITEKLPLTKAEKIDYSYLEKQSYDEYENNQFQKFKENKQIRLC